MNNGVSPLLSMLSELKELKKQIDGSDDSVLKDLIGKKVDEIMLYGQEAYEEMTIILEENDSIRANETLTEEERNVLLAQNLDYCRELIPKESKDDFEEKCKTEFSDIWEKLESESQEFLTTARYLSYALKMRKRGNYAPVINEMCRAYENELKKKIYDDFVFQMAQKQVIDMDPTTESIKSAVSKKRRNKDYFISDTEMVFFIESLRTVRNNQSGYLGELKFYLQYNEAARNYIDKYRNESAHANLMDEKKADNCHKQTQKVVGYFIKCKK